MDVLNINDPFLSDHLITTHIVYSRTCLRRHFIFYSKRHGLMVVNRSNVVIIKPIGL